MGVSKCWILNRELLVYITFTLKQSSITHRQLLILAVCCTQHNEISHFCKVSTASKQQHNLDSRKEVQGKVSTLKVKVVEFITIYENALNLTRMYCAMNNPFKAQGLCGTSSVLLC